MTDLPVQAEQAYQWMSVSTTIFSFIAMFFSVYSAIELWRRRRAYRENAARSIRPSGFADLFARHSASSSANPFALSINLLPNQESCRPDIERFYKDRGMSCPMLAEVGRRGIGDPANDIAGLLDEIVAKRTYLDEEVATEIHLFFAGPLAAALHVGAALDNWKLVKVYQMNRDRQYEYWGVL